MLTLGSATVNAGSTVDGSGVVLATSFSLPPIENDPDALNPGEPVDQVLVE